MPPEQFGKQGWALTELVARVVIETVKTAWTPSLTTLVLQLDLKAAFDTVNCEGLIALNVQMAVALIEVN